VTSRFLNERYECSNSLEHEKIVIVDHKFFVTKARCNDGVEAIGPRIEMLFLPNSPVICIETV